MTISICTKSWQPGPGPRTPYIHEPKGLVIKLFHHCKFILVKYHQTMEFPNDEIMTEWTGTFKHRPYKNADEYGTLRVYLPKDFDPKQQANKNYKYYATYENEGLLLGGTSGEAVLTFRRDGRPQDFIVSRWMYLFGFIPFKGSMSFQPDITFPDPKSDQISSTDTFSGEFRPGPLANYLDPPGHFTLTRTNDVANPKRSKSFLSEIWPSVM